LDANETVVAAADATAIWLHLKAVSTGKYFKTIL